MYLLKNQVESYKKNIFDYVYKTNIFSKDFCFEKIKQIEKSNFSKWESHRWSSSFNYNDSANIEDFSIVFDNKNTEDMIDGIVDAVSKYQKYVSKFSSISHISNIRINRYDVGQKMIEHVDHIHGIFDGENKGIPIMSILGVLNDDYEGGDFLICGEKIDLNTGDILIFPSSFVYPHRVEPVTSGSRYSWITWGY